MKAALFKSSIRTAAQFVCLCAAILLLFLPKLSAQEDEPKQPLFGSEGIRPQAVRQGTLGSCYFHSVAAALAAADPDGTSKMIHEEKEGTFTVEFVDSRKEIAYLEDVQYSRSSGYDLSDGLWVAVLFRAYAQRVLREALVQAVDKSALLSLVKHYAEDFVESNDAVVLAYDRAIRASVDQQGEIDKAKLEAQVKAELQPISVPDDIKDSMVRLIESGGFLDSIAAMIKENGELFGAYRAVGHGGIAGRAMTALAGKSVEIPNQSAAQLSIALADAVRAHRPIVACTAGSRYYQQLAENQTIPDSAKPWYINAHCYTVLAYDPSAQTVTLRNPWGQPPQPDGIFKLPLTEFLPAFRGIVTTEP